MKMIEGAFFFAVSKRSLTLEAPTPTNISTKSEPEMEKKGTPASPATAFASSVLPVPGGPMSRTPLGILAPMSLYFLGFLRKSTISASSCFSSSAPATSLNVFFFLDWFLIFALPKLLILAPPPACLIIKKKSTNMRISIISEGRRL